MPRSLLIIFVCTVVFTYSDAKKPPRCPENEVWDECGRWCEPTCKNPNPACPAIVCTTDPGCRCAKDYVRNENGDCVKECQCPKCAKGEVLLSCGRICEGTCAKPWIPDACAHTQCFVASCGCDTANGWVRCKSKDICVKKNKCRRPCHHHHHHHHHHHE